MSRGPTTRAMMRHDPSIPPRQRFPGRRRPGLGREQDIERLRSDRGLRGRSPTCSTPPRTEGHQRLADTLAEQNAFLRKALRTAASGRRAPDRDREFSERVSGWARGWRAPAPRRSRRRPRSGAGGGGTAPAPPLPRRATPPRRASCAARPTPTRPRELRPRDQEYREYLRIPTPTSRQRAQYWIGECYFSKGRYNEAVAAWDDLMRDYPASDKLPDARYRRASRWKRSAESPGRRSSRLPGVCRRYPNSDAGHKAREKLN
jgi:hypothetical protein